MWIQIQSCDGHSWSAYPHVHQLFECDGPHVRAHSVRGISVHADKAALVENPLEVLSVGRVVAVIDLHPSQVDAFLLEDFDLTFRHVACREGVGHQRDSGLQVGPSGCSGHHL